MWTRAELKANAKKFFKFNYWKMVLAALVLGIAGGGGSSSSVTYSNTYRNSISSDNIGTVNTADVLGYLAFFAVLFTVIFVFALVLGLFLLNPLQVGAQRFFVVSHYQKAELGELGYAFSQCYMNVVKTMFLRGLYIFLWSLLFVIPGIVKSYEYRMIPYILAENPNIDSKEAFAISKRMMDGNKLDAWILDWSFVGWAILSACTCGILGIFYVNPYMYMTYAELYVALKEITFGNQNYQNYQTYQNQGYNTQRYQNYQTDQAYWNGQNDQGSWNNQNGQTYQYDQYGQNYQGNQTYQSGQNYQGYQGGQNYQGYQTYQSSRNYQGDQMYQNGQGYQSGQTYRDDQSYQSGQDYQNGQSYQSGQTYQNDQSYQGGQTYQDNQSYQGDQTYCDESVHQDDQDDPN